MRIVAPIQFFLVSGGPTDQTDQNKASVQRAHFWPNFLFFAVWDLFGQFASGPKNVNFLIIRLKKDLINLKQDVLLQTIYFR